MNFNLANYLIEEAYFSLPKDLTAQEMLRKKIEDLINSAASLRARDPSAFHDAEGMLEVSFSHDPIVLRRAVDDIYKGIQDVPLKERDVANSFFELNIRLAWRRLLEAELVFELVGSEEERVGAGGDGQVDGGGDAVFTELVRFADVD